jgi:hypothetical protein
MVCSIRRRARSVALEGFLSATFLVSASVWSVERDRWSTLEPTAAPAEVMANARWMVWRRVSPRAPGLEGDDDACVARQRVVLGARTDARPEGAREEKSYTEPAAWRDARALCVSATRGDTATRATIIGTDIPALGPARPERVREAWRSRLRPARPVLGTRVFYWTFRR